MRRGRIAASLNAFKADLDQGPVDPLARRYHAEIMGSGIEGRLEKGLAYRAARLLAQADRTRRGVDRVHFLVAASFAFEDLEALRDERDPCGV